MDAEPRHMHPGPSDTADHDDSPNNPGPNGVTKRRTQISVACDSCRSKKIKCSGGRPTCAFCDDRKIDCTYDRDPDVTRLGSLRRRHTALEEELLASREAVTRVLEVLYADTDEAIGNLIGHIRSLPDVPAVLQALQAGQLVAPLDGSPPADGIQPMAPPPVPNAHAMADAAQAHHNLYGSNFSPGGADGALSHRPPPSDPMRIENLLSYGRPDVASPSSSSGSPVPKPDTRTDSSHFSRARNSR